MYVLKNENGLENSNGNINCNLAELFRRVLLCEQFIFLVIPEHAEKKQGKKIEEVLKKFVDKRLSTEAFKCADVGHYSVKGMIVYLT